MEFHPLSELDARTKPEILAEARAMAERDLMESRLREMREKHGARQSDVALPKLGQRRDSGVFSLVDYVKRLGMGMETVAVPKTAGAKREILLRV